MIGSSRFVSRIAIRSTQHADIWSRPSLAAIICLGVSVSCVAVPCVAQQTPGGAAPAEYEESIRGALREYELQHWAEARALFTKAHAASPNARTLRGLGQTAFMERKYVVALQYLSQALTDARRPLTAEMRTEVEHSIALSQTYVARYRLRVSPAEARVELDGEPAVLDQHGLLLADPGSHEIVVVADGFVSASRKIEAQPNQETELVVELQSSAPKTAAPEPVLPRGDAWSSMIKQAVKENDDKTATEREAERAQRERWRTTVLEKRKALRVFVGAEIGIGSENEPFKRGSLAIQVRDASPALALSVGTRLGPVPWLLLQIGTDFSVSFPHAYDASYNNFYDSANTMKMDPLWGFRVVGQARFTPLSGFRQWYLGPGLGLVLRHVSGRGSYYDNGSRQQVPWSPSVFQLGLTPQFVSGFLLGSREEWDVGLAVTGTLPFSFGGGNAELIFRVGYAL